MSMPLVSCPACGGLSPAACRACVHCEQPLVARRFARIARALGRTLLAGGALVTLMACYGMVSHRRPAGYTDCGPDGDQDGVCRVRDCDDTKADHYPGAADPDLDGLDQNCDGVDGWRDPEAVVAEPPAPESAESSEPAEPDMAPPAIATDPPAPPPSP